MMHKSSKLFSVAILCAAAGLFFLGAVPSPSAKNAMPGIQLLLLSGKNIVEVTGNITTNTTWKNSNIYLIRAYDFYVQATLTIEPGTIIKFHPTDGPYMVLGNGGKIMANGTAAKPIIFTSYKDDVHGGDTNMDGSSTTPAGGDWMNIATNGEQDSEFSYCHFFYGGGGSYLNTLELWDSRATVINCLFAHNRGGKSGDFYYGSLDASQARAGTVIEGNRFYGNIQPLSVGWKFSLDDSNTFQSEDGTLKNMYNGIYYNSSDNISGNLSWGETEVAFVIDDNDLWVNSGFKLTLGNDVVVKFANSSELVLADGASALVNYNGPGVYFTSYKDDTKNGDTNGDGSATSPAVGDWIGIYDDTAPLGGPYYFSWSNILYDEIH
jgi:hypothetical protein